MGLKLRMWILLAMLFGALYGLVAGVGTYLNIGNAVSYIVLAIGFCGYMMSCIGSKQSHRYIYRRANMVPPG